MLLVIATLATLNHLLLIFTQQDERLLFLGWAAFNIYATLVLAISFRRRERWAWYTTWVMVIGFALPLLLGLASEIAVLYAIVAGVMALGLLLTMPTFFQKQQAA